MFSNVGFGLGAAEDLYVTPSGYDLARTNDFCINLAACSVA